MIASEYIAGAIGVLALGFGFLCYLLMIVNILIVIHD